MSVWTEKPAAQDKSVVLCRSDGAQSDNRSFAHQIKEKAQNNITRPNNSNVVAESVFAKLWKKNKYRI